MSRPMRPNGMSRAYASVSVFAMLGLMAGCSQPSSYATVDLGGSHAGNVPQAYNAQQAYAPQYGQPVYQSTQVYTNPYNTGYAQPQQQLVYQDAPQNQVASLAPVYGNAYSQPVQQSYPTFGNVDQGPVLTDETILRSDGFIDVGAYGGTRTATLAPGAGSIGYDRMTVVSDVPEYLPAPQAFAQAPLAEPIPLVEPVIAETVPQAPQVSMIETGQLPDLPSFSTVPDAVESPAPIANDYASLTAETYSPFAETVVPQNAPMAPLIESTPIGLMQATPESFAGLSELPARDDAQSVVDYYDLRSAEAGTEAREVGLATAVPAPQAPARIASAPNGRGIVLPPASTEYPRPYDGLPPGFFPTYEFPSGGDLISQGAPVEQGQQFAAFEPAPAEQARQFAAFEPAPSPAQTFLQPVAFEPSVTGSLDQASSRVFGGLDHTIRSGDTLYSIARLYSVTPESIAGANGIDLSGTIFPGNVISIPADEMSQGPDALGDAPIVVLQTAEAASTSTFVTDLTDQSASMIDIDELARMFREREDGQIGAGMPIISAEAGAAMRGRPDLQPTEIISEPQGSITARTTGFVTTPTPVAVTRGSYAWPIHGEVYRLSQGEIEIDAPMGQAVAATAAGRVVDVQNGSRGYLVVVEHDDGWRSLTLGLRDITVQPGQRVLEGATIGRTGQERIRFELRDGASNVAETLGILRS